MCAEASFGIAIGSLDELERDSVIYRGYMMKPEQYSTFHSTFYYNRYDLINTVQNYNHCHLLPNSACDLKQFMPTVVYAAIVEGVTTKEQVISSLYRIVKRSEHDWILKDFVKSEKDIPGLLIIEKEISEIDFSNKIDLFINERGKLFTSGICLRSFVDLREYSVEHYEDAKMHKCFNEWRNWYFKGKLICSEQNSNLKDVSSPSVEFLNELGEKLYSESNYFTIDVAEKANHGWVVLETGDGQVSGLAPNQNPSTLYENFE